MTSQTVRRRGRFGQRAKFSLLLVVPLIIVSLTHAGCGNLTSSVSERVVHARPLGISAPSITSQPMSQTIGAGQMATFLASASGSDLLSYQWKKNGLAITGATSSSYTTPVETMSDNLAQFVVVVSNSAGSVSSTTAILTVKSASPASPGTPLQIATSSLPNGEVGVPFQSSVAATGGVPPYNWTVVGSLPPGLSLNASSGAIASGSLSAGLSLGTNGTISGTPTTSGSFPMGVTVTDSSATPQTATQTHTLTVQAAAPPPTSGNPTNATDTVTIYEADGTTQPARPVTFGRVFAQGEITQCPQPLVDGSTVSAWQADIKNRWPDGSVKFAVISLITALNPGGSATVSFQSNATCNNSGYISTSSSPSFATFNSGNWDARITVAAPGSTTVTTSAKTMLAAIDPGGNTYGDCKNDYWLQGPVVTAVIAQDCTSAMSFDFGWSWNGSTMTYPVTGSTSTASFHPMFILYFYPSINAVQAEEIIELPWNGKEQDQLADLAFSSEDSSGAVHTRWSRTGARVIGGVTASTTMRNPPAVSTTTLTANGANFSASGVGMPVCVAANYSSAPTCGTIQSVTNSTTAVMAMPTGWSDISGSGLTAWINLQSAATRHRKTFWSGTAPGHIRIDYNFAYLISTKAIPSYDLVNAFINPNNGHYPGGKCCDYGWAGWTGTDRGEIGGFGGENSSYASMLEGAPLRRADLAYLYNMGTCGSADSYCAKAWQQLTGTTALGDLSTHAGLDSSATTQFDVSGGAGMWDNFGNVPFHFRESRTSSSNNGYNGQTGGNCFYVSSFENKNATDGTLSYTSSTSCTGQGDGNVLDPSGPNNATGRAISLHAHSDTIPSANTFGASTVGATFNPMYGWDVIDEGPYHWQDYSYLPYLLTGSPYYLDSMYQSASFASLNNTNPEYGNAGIFDLYNSGVIYRWFAWAMQTTSRAAFIAPDGSAESSYYQSVLNSNLEFVEGALGVTGSTLTPASSQGNFAASGTITNFNINAANRWDLGRYVSVTGGACATTGSGSCTIVSPGMHQWAQGICVSLSPGNLSGTNTGAFGQYWMYWYIITVLGEMRDMGYTQAQFVHNQTEQFLEGMALSPASNPWLGLASYTAPMNSGGSSSCTATYGSNLPFFTSYRAIFQGFNNSVGNPTTVTSPGNFSHTPSTGGTGTGNYPCADHGYSLLARAAGTFLNSYGVVEADTNGSYAPTTAWSWLNANVPYFGNTAYQALPNDCVAGSDVQIKWALTPRQ